MARGVGKRAGSRREEAPQGCGEAGETRHMARGRGLAVRGAAHRPLAASRHGRGLRHKARGGRRLPSRGREGDTCRRRKSRKAGPHKRSLKQLDLTQFKTASLAAEAEAG